MSSTKRRHSLVLSVCTAFFTRGTKPGLALNSSMPSPIRRGVNERIAHLYEPTHPAIVRLIELTVQAAHTNGIWVGVCGEMAGEISLTPLLIGLGIDELSASPGFVPRVKKAVQTLSTKECLRLVDDIRSLNAASEILKRCEDVARRHYAELLS